MTADVHCPECGALTRVDHQDDGDEVRVCMNDECPLVIVAVVSRPAPDIERWRLTI